MKNFARFLAQESKHLYETDIKSVLTWLYDLFEKVEESKRPRDLRPSLIPCIGCDKPRYNFQGLHMSLLGKDRRLLNTPTHCRDYFNEVLRHWITKRVMRSFHVESNWPGKFDKSAFRAVLFLDRRLSDDIPRFDGLKNGVRVANMYGSVAGWQKLRILRGVIKYAEGEKEVFILIGDKNWQRTPQFISMLFLLIRVCLMHEVPKWIKDAYSLQAYWHEMFHQNILYPDSSDFSEFLCNSYDCLLTLVANERDIFPLEAYENFDPKLASFHPESGLDYLVHGRGTHRESATLLQQLHTEVLKNVGKESWNYNWD